MSEKDEEQVIEFIIEEFEQKIAPSLVSGCGGCGGCGSPGCVPCIPVEL
jgi:hypothetical protein